MIDPERYLVVALEAVGDAVRALDRAIDEGHDESLSEDTREAIAVAAAYFSWCTQFLFSEEPRD